MVAFRKMKVGSCIAGRLKRIPEHASDVNELLLGTCHKGDFSIVAEMCAIEIVIRINPLPLLWIALV